MTCSTTRTGTAPVPGTEVVAPIDSIRAVGEVYGCVAACVEYDNRPQTCAEPTEIAPPAQHSQHYAALAAERTA